MGYDDIGQITRYRAVSLSSIRLRQHRGFVDPPLTLLENEARGLQSRSRSGE